MKHHTRLYPLFFEDITLVTITIIIAGSLLFSSFSSTSGKSALLYENNVLIENLDLNKPALIRHNKMIIEVNNHQVRVKESDCPEQICTHKGWISNKGQIIVCAPNHVLIEISNAP